MTISLRRSTASFSLMIALVTLLIARATGSASAQAITLEALQRDGYGVVELKRPKPNILTVVATINNRKMILLVDTGAFAPGIMLQEGQAIGLGTGAEAIKETGRSASGAKLTFKKGNADHVQIGNVEMRQVPIHFGNFKGLERQSSAPGSMTRYDGLLGSDFLRTCSGVIDLHNLRLYLRPPGTGHRVDIGPALRASGLAVASLSEGNLVDVEIEGGAGHMLVDTGAYLATVDTRFAQQVKTAVRGSFVGSIDVAGVISKTQIAHPKSFKIGGTLVDVPDLRLGTMSMYRESGGKMVGLLGMDILGRNGTIIDMGQRKLYFYPAK